MNRPLVFTVLGAAAAGAGIFLPAMRVEDEVLRYWDLVPAQAIILLLGAFFALLAAWKKERVGLAAGAVAMWGALLWPWISGFFAEKEESGLAAAASEAGADAAQLAEDVVWHFGEMSWGLLVLGFGCLLVSCGAIANGGGKGKKGKPKPKGGDE
jgi:hypothetical protein